MSECPQSHLGADLLAHGDERDAEDGDALRGEHVVTCGGAAAPSARSRSLEAEGGRDGGKDGRMEELLVRGANQCRGGSDGRSRRPTCVGADVHECVGEAAERTPPHASVKSASPRWLRPRPSGSQRAYVSFSSVSLFSMMVCTMVEVTSPLQEPTAIMPHASAVTPTT
ncbi:hypothetical protein EYF80_050791 [Liparis tanakae]|uniref:Uncharacterized protein n=1 Tax=Liparis tanakae TaxID=230148 RepID=A0A4Z2FF52_9TELE|nr:hypothetical protein EYF80_050791 [Liparis tanakae]